MFMVLYYKRSTHSQPSSQAGQPVEICITLSLINIFYAPFEFHSKSKFAHTPTFFHFISKHFVLLLPSFRVGRHFDIDRSNPKPQIKNIQKINENPPEKPMRCDWQRVKNDFESGT